MIIKIMYQDYNEPIKKGIEIENLIKKEHPDVTIIVGNQTTQDKIIENIKEELRKIK